MTTIQIILAIIISLILIVYVIFVIKYCVYYFKYGRYLNNKESNILSFEEERSKIIDISSVYPSKLTKSIRKQNKKKVKK